MQNLEETDARIYPEAWLDLFDYPGGVHPYWLSRFSEEICLRHRLGYDYERDAGTYPLRDLAGRVLGVVRRAFDPDARIKYRYPKGIDLHAEGFLYGYHQAIAADAQTVVLVEGALDAVAVEEAGHTGLAIYGSNPSVAQIKMINRLYPKTVILAFDDDEAGRSATRKVLDSDLVCADVRIVDLDGHNDIADLPVSRRRAAIDAAWY